MEGLYRNFVDNYFNPITREFNFDIEKAVVRCSLFGREYTPDFYADKWMEDISKWELKLEDVEQLVDVYDIPPEYAAYGVYPTNPSFYGSHKELQKHPNGYDGAKSVGKLSILRDVHHYRNDYGDVIYSVNRTALIGANKELRWGKSEAFPDGATLKVYSVVYWLDDGALIGCLGIGKQYTVNGDFTLTQNSKGFARIDVQIE